MLVTGNCAGRSLKYREHTCQMKFCIIAADVCCLLNHLKAKQTVGCPTTGERTVRPGSCWPPKKDFCASAWEMEREMKGVKSWSLLRGKSQQQAVKQPNTGLFNEKTSHVEVVSPCYWKLFILLSFQLFNKGIHTTVRISVNCTVNECRLKRST